MKNATDEHNGLTVKLMSQFQGHQKKLQSIKNEIKNATENNRKKHTQ